MSPTLFAAEGEVAGIGLAVFVVLCVVSFVISMAPLLIALVRGHPQTLPIGIVCFFLGWTCIGWIVALAWSFSAIDSREHRHYHDHDWPRR